MRSRPSIDFGLWMGPPSRITTQSSRPAGSHALARGCSPRRSPHSYFGEATSGGDALSTSNARQIIERATALRVPVTYYWPGTAEMGAVFSHQADIERNYERAAYYVHRILKGAKPSDLPIGDRHAMSW